MDAAHGGGSEDARGAESVQQGLYAEFRPAPLVSPHYLRAENELELDPAVSLKSPQPVLLPTACALDRDPPMSSGRAPHLTPRPTAGQSCAVKPAAVWRGRPQHQARPPTVPGRWPHIPGRAQPLGTGAQASAAAWAAARLGAAAGAGRWPPPRPGCASGGGSAAGPRHLQVFGGSNQLTWQVAAGRSGDTPNPYSLHGYAGKRIAKALDEERPSSAPAGRGPSSSPDSSQWVWAPVSKEEREARAREAAASSVDTALDVCQLMRQAEGDMFSFISGDLEAALSREESRLRQQAEQQQQQPCASGGAAGPAAEPGRAAGRDPAREAPPGADRSESRLAAGGQAAARQTTPPAAGQQEQRDGEAAVAGVGPDQRQAEPTVAELRHTFRAKFILRSCAKMTHHEQKLPGWQPPVALILQRAEEQARAVVGALKRAPAHAVAEALRRVRSKASEGPRARRATGAGEAEEECGEVDPGMQQGLGGGGVSRRQDGDGRKPLDGIVTVANAEQLCTLVVETWLGGNFRHDLSERGLTVGRPRLKLCALLYWACRAIYAIELIGHRGFRVRELMDLLREQLDFAAPMLAAYAEGRPAIAAFVRESLQPAWAASWVCPLLALLGTSYAGEDAEGAAEMKFYTRLDSDEDKGEAASGGKARSDMIQPIVPSRGGSSGSAGSGPLGADGRPWKAGCLARHGTACSSHMPAAGRVVVGTEAGGGTAATSTRGIPPSHVVEVDSKHGVVMAAKRGAAGGRMAKHVIRTDPSRPAHMGPVYAARPLMVVAPQPPPEKLTALKREHADKQRLGSIVARLTDRFNICTDVSPAAGRWKAATGPLSAPLAAPGSGAREGGSRDGQPLATQAHPSSGVESTAGKVRRSNAFQSPDSAALRPGPQPAPSAVSSEVGPTPIAEQGQVRSCPGIGRALFTQEDNADGPCVVFNPGGGGLFGQVSTFQIMVRPHAPAAGSAGRGPPSTRSPRTAADAGPVAEAGIVDPHCSKPGQLPMHHIVTYPAVEEERNGFCCSHQRLGHFEMGLGQQPASLGAATDADGGRASLLMGRPAAQCTSPDSRRPPCSIRMSGGPGSPGNGVCPLPGSAPEVHDRCSPAARGPGQPLERPAREGSSVSFSPAGSCRRTGMAAGSMPLFRGAAISGSSVGQRQLARVQAGAPSRVTLSAAVVGRPLAPGLVQLPAAHAVMCGHMHASSVSMATEPSAPRLLVAGYASAQAHPQEQDQAVAAAKLMPAACRPQLDRVKSLGKHAAGALEHHPAAALSAQGTMSTEACAALDTGGSIIDPAADVARKSEAVAPSADCMRVSVEAAPGAGVEAQGAIASAGASSMGTAALPVDGHTPAATRANTGVVMDDPAGLSPIQQAAEPCSTLPFSTGIPVSSAPGLQTNYVSKPHHAESKLGAAGLPCAAAASKQQSPTSSHSAPAAEAAHQLPVSALVGDLDGRPASLLLLDAGPLPGLGAGLLAVLPAGAMEAAMSYHVVAAAAAGCGGPRTTPTQQAHAERPWKCVRTAPDLLTAASPGTASLRHTSQRAASPSMAVASPVPVPLGLSADTRLTMPLGKKAPDSLLRTADTRGHMDPLWEQYITKGPVNGLSAKQLLGGDGPCGGMAESKDTAKLEASAANPTCQGRSSAHSSHAAAISAILVEHGTMAAHAVDWRCSEPCGLPMCPIEMLPAAEKQSNGNHSSYQHSGHLHVGLGQQPAFLGAGTDADGGEASLLMGRLAAHCTSPESRCPRFSISISGGPMSLGKDTCPLPGSARCSPAARHPGRSLERSPPAAQPIASTTMASKDLPAVGPATPALILDPTVAGSPPGAQSPCKLPVGAKYCGELKWHRSVATLVVATLQIAFPNEVMDAVMTAAKRAKDAAKDAAAEAAAAKGAAAEAAAAKAATAKAVAAGATAAKAAAAEAAAEKADATEAAAVKASAAEVSAARAVQAAATQKIVLHTLGPDAGTPLRRHEVDLRLKGSKWEMVIPKPVMQFVTPEPEQQKKFALWRTTLPGDQLILALPLAAARRMTSEPIGEASAVQGCGPSAMGPCQGAMSLAPLLETVLLPCRVLPGAAEKDQTPASSMGAAALSLEVQGAESYKAAGLDALNKHNKSKRKRMPNHKDEPQGAPCSFKDGSAGPERRKRCR